MAKIHSVTAKEILDSRGIPTIEATVTLSDGSVGISSVPSGASTGTFEAHELRDNDKNRFEGKGVLQAVQNVNTIIAPKIKGVDSISQQKIDKTMIELDGTQNKIKLGANAILSVSQAVAKASARSSLIPLSIYLRQFLSFKSQAHRMPTPLFNMIEGGKHADNGLNFQEFLVIPASSQSYETSLSIGVTIYSKLKNYLRENNMSTLVADEGGFAPNFSGNKQVFNALKLAVGSTPYVFLKDIFLGIDAAANSFWDNKRYFLMDRNTQVDRDGLLEFYREIINEYSLIYLEDPFAEGDVDGWKNAFKNFSAKTLIVGDDLVTTNPYRLQTALSEGVISGIIVKPNQIGTITETLAVVEIAKFKGLKITVSHRSGETQDDFIADFAVAIDSDYVKFGAPSRERVIKYNRLSQIEKEIKTFSAL